MSEKPVIDHKRIGIGLFNATWELVEKPDRTAFECDQMVHMAHASRYHWSLADGHRPENIGRGEWQVSHVYAILGRGEPALHHARRCLEICEVNGIADFDIAYAHEALARGFAAAGDGASFAVHHVKSQALATVVANQRDRELLIKDLETGPWFGLTPPVPD